jgi:hypothetical protein
MRYLYPNFLRDEQEYAQAELFWRSLWDKVMRLAGQAQEWQVPWLQTTFSDGTPIRDGDPMFSAVCQGRRLAVHAIQNESQDGEEEFDAYVTVFDPEAQGIRVLVISCVLSEESASRIKDLLSSWVQTGQVQLPLPPLDGPGTGGPHEILPAQGTTLSPGEGD